MRQRNGNEAEIEHCILNDYNALFLFAEYGSYLCTVHHHLNEVFMCSYSDKIYKKANLSGSFQV